MNRVKIVILSMIVAIFAACTAKPDPTIWVKVTINSTPDSAAIDLNKIIGNQRVKIIGTLNELDFWMLRACPTLYYLDLSEVTVVGDVIISPQTAIEPEISQVGNAIPAGAFGATTIYLPDLDTTIILKAHPSLRSIVLPPSITAIGKFAFNSCGISHPIELPRSLLKIYDSAFNQCGSLSGTLTLPENLTYLGAAAFNQCGNLTGELTTPRSLDSISPSAFANCNGLTKIVLHDGIRKIGRSAFAATTISELNLPSQLVEIDSGAFRNCRHLSGSLDLPQSLTHIGNRAFEYSGFDGTLTIPSSIDSLGISAFDSTYIERIELHWQHSYQIPPWDSSKRWFPKQFETENYTHQYLIIVPQSTLNIYQSHFAFRGKSFYNFEQRQ